MQYNIQIIEFKFQCLNFVNEPYNPENIKTHFSLFGWL